MNEYDRGATSWSELYHGSTTRRHQNTTTLKAEERGQREAAPDEWTGNCTYKTTKSGNPVEFCARAPWRWPANTAGLIRFFAQLNVIKSRSRVDGAMSRAMALSAAKVDSIGSVRFMGINNLGARDALLVGFEVTHRGMPGSDAGI